VRTFPKALAAFRKIVEERGKSLRQMRFSELSQLNGAGEHLIVESRPATIGIIVLPLPSGGLQVVVQGFLEHRFMPGKSVAMASLNIQTKPVLQ
jgi:hypothetical protein